MRPEYIAGLVKAVSFLDGHPSMGGAVRKLKRELYTSLSGLPITKKGIKKIGIVKYHPSGEVTAKDYGWGYSQTYETYIKGFELPAMKPVVKPKKVKKPESETLTQYKENLRTHGTPLFYKYLCYAKIGSRVPKLIDMDKRAKALTAISGLVENRQVARDVFDKLPRHLQNLIADPAYCREKYAEISDNTAIYQINNWLGVNVYHKGEQYYNRDQMKYVKAECVKSHMCFFTYPTKEALRNLLCDHNDKTAHEPGKLMMEFDTPDELVQQIVDASLAANKDNAAGLKKMGFKVPE